MTIPDRPELVRSIGRWSLAALILNSIIGTGVFVLPGTVAGKLGWNGMWAWVLAAGFTAAMVFCFAEVASRFSVAGGAYVFTQAAFGRFVGIQTAWMTYFVRAISAAVQANLFSTYLAEFWPWAATRPGGIFCSTFFLGTLAVVNIRSVQSGTGVSNVFAVIKTVPLLAFGALGISWILTGHGGAAPVASDPSLSGWLQMLLLLMFGYGGFESGLIPLAEAKNPRKDAPFALLLGLALVTLVYLAAQLTVLSTLSDPAANNRPLAASARVMLGAGGAAAITIVALTSVYGWVASNMLSVPRLTMAMAERGDLPAFFGRVHPVYRTPWISVLIFSGLSWVLANQAGLISNLSLSAVSRLFVYGGVCAALPVLRRKEGKGVDSAQFRAPAGPLLAVLGVAIAIVLASRMTLREGVTMAVTVAIATGHWWVMRKKRDRGIEG